MDESLPSQTPVVRVHTLGRLGVEAPSGEVRAILRQPKRFALLTYLTLATKGGFCRRDAVVAVFWPELDQDHARGALRNALYFLRKELEHDVLHTEGDEAIRIDSAKVWCDAVAFDDAVRSGTYESAMELYRGDFLDGFHLNGSTQFDEWRGNRQREFRRQAVTAALELAALVEETNDLVAAEGWAHRATELAPHDDEPVRRLIALLQKTHKRGAALEVFDLFKERLAEIDLHPAPETVRLVGALRTEAGVSGVSSTTGIDASHEDLLLGPTQRAVRGGSIATGTVGSRLAASLHTLRPRRYAATALGLMGLIALVVLFVPAWLERRWARSEGFRDLRSLVSQQDFVPAFDLARRLAPVLDGDPEFGALRMEMTFPMSVHSSPESATVYIKDYRRPEDEWILLGATPLDSVYIPATYLRWRVERPGFAPLERAALDAYMRPVMRFLLQPEGLHPGMIHVSGDAMNMAAPASMPLGEYWLDRFEVSNREYADFVNSGGYERRDLWPREFERTKATLSLDEGISLMTDRSGHPGPSAWTAGAYPSDEGDFPVSGVSWYEAAAYCRWVGKELPTVYHWYGAGGYHGYSSILALSNFSTEGPAPVGKYRGIGPYGHYDLAGNVREWALNAAEGMRYVLGGAWDSPQYLYWGSDAAPPLDRSPRNGFRCAIFDEPVEHASRDPVRLRPRNFENEPVDDAVFETYRSLYAYDNAPLNAAVDSVSDVMPHWSREYVSFDAVYGAERMQAHLFVPKNTNPPYSAVVYYPGADAFALNSSAQLHTWWFDFIVRNGRAVIYPIYKGTYERRVPLSGPKDHREQFVQRAKDLRRSVDYLESRADIDADEIAYFGFSAGGGFAPVFAAVEDRFVTSMILSGGLYGVRFDPIMEPTNYLSRAHTPLLMVGGELDFIFPPASSQRPFFEAWAVASEHKRYVAIPHGHAPTEMRAVASEVLDWLDRYLGPADADSAARYSEEELLGLHGSNADTQRPK